MGKKLAGVQFVRNAIEQDYCVVESILSMLGVCDHVYIVDAGSTDGTQEIIESINTDRLTMIATEDDEWDNQYHLGPLKLSFFANIAMDYAQRRGMDYLLYVQSDEVVHQDSYHNIRMAVEDGKEGYVFNRYNLFKDPYHMLNVEQSRKPCSTEVIRLFKSKYRAYSDGEHGLVPDVAVYKSLDAIEIFHLGYVRDKKKHLVKIKHMLTEVFKMGMDTRAENCEEFQWDRFFSEEDLIPIPKDLPKVVQQWVKERYPELK